MMMMQQMGFGGDLEIVSGDYSSSENADLESIASDGDYREADYPGLLEGDGVPLRRCNSADALHSWDRPWLSQSSSLTGSPKRGTRSFAVTMPGRRAATPLASGLSASRLSRGGIGAGIDSAKASPASSTNPLGPHSAAPVATTLSSGETKEASQLGFHPFSPGGAGEITSPTEQSPLITVSSSRKGTLLPPPLNPSTGIFQARAGMHSRQGGSYASPRSRPHLGQHRRLKSTNDLLRSTDRKPLPSKGVPKNKWLTVLSEEHEPWHAPLQRRCLGCAVRFRAFRRALYYFLSNNAIFSLIIMLFIVVSSITFCLESLEKYRTDVENGGELPKVFPLVELVAVLVFTVEYLGRLLTVTASDDFQSKAEVSSREKREKAKGSHYRSSTTPTPEPRHCCSSFGVIARFVKNPMNLIDVMAILPYYLEQLIGSGGGGLTVFRILRLGRVFRVFKLGKYSTSMQLMARVIVNSSDALKTLSFFMIIGVIVFGAAIFFAESGNFECHDIETDSGPEPLCAFYRDDPTGKHRELTPFTSIPAAFWWVAVTFTTVGYGDFVPTSFFGRLIGAITMNTGILVLALPITVIGANVQLEYHEKFQARMKETQRKAALANAAASSASHPTTHGGASRSGKPPTSRSRGGRSPVMEAKRSLGRSSNTPPALVRQLDSTSSRGLRPPASPLGPSMATLSSNVLRHTSSVDESAALVFEARKSLVATRWRLVRAHARYVGSAIRASLLRKTNARLSNLVVALRATATPPRAKQPLGARISSSLHLQSSSLGSADPMDGDSETTDYAMFDEGGDIGSLSQILDSTVGSGGAAAGAGGRAGSPPIATPSAVRMGSRSPLYRSVRARAPQRSDNSLGSSDSNNGQVRALARLLHQQSGMLESLLTEQKRLTQRLPPIHATVLQ